MSIECLRCGALKLPTQFAPFSRVCAHCANQKEPAKAPTRTITNGTVRELYVPAKDNAYYRNDGNKHIKSRGH
jgi:hypothetical protein